MIARALSLLTPLVILGLAAPATWAQRLSPTVVTDVAHHLTGIMETTAQAEVNPNFVAVRMTTCPVEVIPAESDTVYLYQEQALVEALTEPYRQRFLRIALSDDEQRIESRTLKPVAAEPLIGLCNQTLPQMNVADLGTPVCTVALRPSALGYVGSTPEEGCPVSVRGATYLTNVIVLHAHGMDTWDRGFNADGIQVWGAQAEPYRYRWVGDSDR
ncbi:MAG: chromophore lyase CpcT/CpeT [Cyanobacteria bacterium J06632_22]